jgi:hypothetical protein
MRPRPDNATDRGAGALVLVLPVVALLTMLVLSAAVTVRLRWVEADDTLRRQDARDAARTGIAGVLHGLVADTNGVDSLDETWATDERLSLSDEEARIDLRIATTPVLAALFAQAAGVPGRQAEVLALSVVGWRERQPAPPPALELFAFAPGMDAALLAGIAPYATVHGNGLVNLNTADETVMRILLIGNGTVRDVQDRMLTALRAARRGGMVCPIIDAQTLATVFVGPRRIPDPATAQAITALAPLLGVESTAFRGVSVGTPPDVEAPRHAISFVYSRPTRSFLRWVE